MKTKRVCINKCYGGFSLSPKAVKRLAELERKQCYFFINEYENGKARHIPIQLENIKELFWSAYTVPNPDKVAGNQDNWHEMSIEERQESNRKWNDISLDSRPNDRANPNLIKVIEELGEEANGDCAKLKIVEIPEDVDFEIEEYDGMEWVAEKHRTW